VNTYGLVLPGPLDEHIVVAIQHCLERCCICLMNWWETEGLQGGQPLVEDTGLVHWDMCRSSWAGVMARDGVLESTAGWASLVG